MRRNDWEKQLVETVSRHDAPFHYGSNDCCGFAHEVVYAVTGRRVDHDYQYTGKRDALRLLKRHGGVVGIVDGILDRTSNPMRGDVVADEHDGKFCLGVCMGHVSAFISPKGMEYKSLTGKSVAWGVN